MKKMKPGKPAPAPDADEQEMDSQSEYAPDADSDADPDAHNDPHDTRAHPGEEDWLTHSRRHAAKSGKSGKFK